VKHWLETGEALALPAQRRTAGGTTAKANAPRGKAAKPVRGTMAPRYANGGKEPRG
jgi:hypothetical protein